MKSVARTAERSLELLSLLQTADRWSGPELAARLGVTLRTLGRDIATPRQLGYPVQASSGRTSTYRLGSGGSIPPLLLDDEQAVAISLALQTSPITVLGLRDAADRALNTLAQVMPAPLRAQVDATRVTTIRNYWEFAAPPIAVDVLNTVGNAVRLGQLLRMDILRPGNTRPDPKDPGFRPPSGSSRTTWSCGPDAGTSSLTNPSVDTGWPNVWTGSTPTHPPGNPSPAGKCPAAACPPSS